MMLQKQISLPSKSSTATNMALEATAPSTKYGYLDLIHAARDPTKNSTCYRLYTYVVNNMYSVVGLR